MKQKKPTKNDFKTVINNLLIEMSHISSSLRALDAALGSYIEMNGDTKKWNDYLEDSIKKAKEEHNAKQKQSKGK